MKYKVYFTLEQWAKLLSQSPPELIEEASRQQPALAACVGSEATGPAGGDGSIGAEGVNLDSLTIAELKEYASEGKIDLGDATKKADIITAIKAAN